MEPFPENLAAADLTAAVAVVRTEEPDPRYLILQRAAHPADPWSGHLAFPGGRREPADVDLLATARRETLEECGVDLSAQDGSAVPPHRAGQAVGRSLWVQPFLFRLPTTVPIVCCPREIARGFWVPASALCRHDRHDFAPMSRHLHDTLFPYVPVDDARLWGFTYHLVMSVLADPSHRPADAPEPPRLRPRPA